MACQIQSKKKKKINQYLESITLVDFKKKKNRKETFIVYIAHSICYDCELLNEQIINDMKNNESLKKLVYMEISESNENDDEWNDFKINHSIISMPVFIYVKNGKEESSYSWSEEKGFNYKEFLEWVKDKV